MLPNTHFLRVAPALPAGWQDLKLGAGGYITGISMSADGATKVIRTDTYGGYRLVGSLWVQLVTSLTMPAGDLLPLSGIGVYEVQVAPSDANRVYMAWKDSVYRSNDGGAHWSVTGLTGKTFDPNTSDKLMESKMAIDPINPDVVYFGVLNDNLYYTVNGGTSWNTVSTAQVGAAGSMGYSAMLFDPSGGTAAGRTKNLFVASHRKGLYRSTDSGATFTLLTGSGGGGTQPQLGDRVYTDGVTTLGSATHTSATAVFTAFDEGHPISGTNIEPGTYIATYTNATTVTLSRNALGTGTGITMTIAGGVLETACVDPVNGKLHACIGAQLGFNTYVWRYTAPSTWLQTTTVADYAPHGIAVDPADHTHVVFQRISGGGLAQSNDTGATWDYTAIYPPQTTWTAPDIPWLGVTGVGWGSGADIKFDPVVASKLWNVEGIAPWTTSATYGLGVIPWTSIAAGIEQLVVNRIIKPPGGSVLVAVWDRGTFKLDNLAAYPTTYKPTVHFDATWDLDYAGGTPLFIVGNHGDNQGNSLDAGYSQDGGASWTTFPAMPLGAASPYTYGFGSMAVSTDTQHIVWCAAPNQWPYYSANRGTAWSKCVIPALIDPTDGSSPRNVWGFTYSLDRHIVCADKVTSNAMTMFVENVGANDITTTSGSPNVASIGTPPFLFVAGDVGRPVIGTNIPANTTILSFTDSTHVVLSQNATGSTANGSLIMIVGGFYSSTDGGINWAVAGPSLAIRSNNSAGTVGQALYWANFNASLQSVPGKAGHLWFTGGPVGSNPDSLTPDGYAFIRSQDGGVTWTIPNANVLEVYCFGFGLGSGSYPSIYIIGWVNGTYGVWRSDDEAVTWTNIGTWPLDSIDSPTTITGDMDLYGRCYVGFRGSGAAYRSLV